MSFLYTAVAFLLALGPLIIFHELGHYWVARACGVKVLRFSLGMGKVVWSRRFGPDQTEWAVSALPLGGYVQMLDSRDPSTAPIDLAVEDPHHPGRLAVAVESDGPGYAGMSSARDRDRLRAEHLGRLGWQHVRVWTRDAFRDPARDVARIRSLTDRGRS